MLHNLQQNKLLELLRLVALIETSRKDGLQSLFVGLSDYPRKLVRQNSYWKNKYAESCLLKYGVTISEFTRDFSWLLCRVHELEFH
ncbi:MAG: hypothetical protein WA919_28130, partial [Coleofasciculaceae cyanobacterium]